MTQRQTLQCSVCSLLTAFLAEGCVKEEEPPALGSTMQVLLRNDSMEMAREYAAWAKQHPRTRVMPLNLSNELHHRVVRNRLLASGKTNLNSPELFSRLAVARSRPPITGPTSNLNDAPWCGQEIPFQEVPARSGQFRSRSMFSCTGGSEYAYTDITTYATNTSFTDFVLLSSTSNEDYATTFIETNRISGNVVPAPGRVMFMDSVTLAYSEDNEFAGYLPADVAAAVPDRDAALTVEHPREIQGNPGDNPIRTCLYRNHISGGPHQDCDYGTVRRNADGSLSPFVSTGATGVAAAIPNPANVSWTPDPASYFPAAGPVTFNYPTIIAYVPIKGSYDAGALNRLDCLNQGTTGTAQLFLLETGGACAGIAVGGVVSGTINLPWTGNDPNAPRWDFSGIMDFGNTCLYNQQSVIMTINIKNDNSSCGAGRGKTIDIRPMDFRNSCLAAGTVVMTASGKAIPVEKLAVGDKIAANGSGRMLTIQGISNGVEPHPMVRLKDDKAHEVMVTDQHPMIRDTGAVVAAGKLAVGDRVMTDKGSAQLISVERVPYAGQVYNVVLGTQVELASLARNDRTLFANGFRVGDSVMQRELEDHSKPAREELLAKLPEAWRRDYMSSIARKAGAAP